MNTTATSPYPAQTITEAMDSYFCPVQDSRSPNTAKAYRQALVEHKFDLNTPPSRLPEDAIAWFADALEAFAPTTERLYCRR